MKMQSKISIYITLLSVIILSCRYIYSTPDNLKKSIDQSNYLKSNILAVEETKPRKLKVQVNCQQLTELSQDLVKNLQAELRYINALMFSEGYSRLTTENIIQAAGFSLDFYRVLHTKDNAYRQASLRPVKGKIRHNTPAQELKFANALIEKNYQKVYDLLGSKLISENSLFANKSILSAIIINDSNISTVAFQNLMNHGLVPVFSDFVTMTEEGVPIENIEAALSFVSNPQELETSWREGEFEKNLTILAAQKFNYSLFLFWRNFGIKPTTNESDYNSLDAIVSPTNAYQVGSGTSIFQVLVAESLYPYKKSTLSKIKQWLPSSVINDFGDYFKNDPKLHLSEHQLKLAKQLFKSRIYTERKLASIHKKTSRCSARLKSLRNLHDLAGDSIQNESVITVKGLLEYYKSIDQDSFLIMNELISSSTMNIIDKMEEFMPRLDASSQFHLMLLSNGTYDDLLPYLDKGAKITPNSITVLIKNNNLELLKKLRPHGLNIFNKKENGKTILHTAIQYGASNSIFDYLVFQGVDINSGPDLISFAINSNGDTVHYLTKLVRNGLSVEKYHLKNVENVGLDLKATRVANFLESQLSIYR